MHSPEHEFRPLSFTHEYVAGRRAGKHHAFLAVCRQRHGGIIPRFGPRSQGQVTDNLFKNQSANSRFALAANLAIVLRRRRCHITSPPQDGFAVANLGQPRKLSGLKARFTKNYLTHRRSFGKRMELTLTFHLRRKLRREKQSSPRKRGEA